MQLASCLLALLSAVSIVSAASLEGSVKAQGKEEAVKAAGAGGSYESRKFKFAEKVDYSQFRDFVVSIEGPLKEKPQPPLQPVKVVTQKDATFKPHVLPVLVGTTVEWPNQDEILHNVFSYSETKQFDLGLYKDEVKRIKFDKTGKVDVFCSIHSKMHCIILVLETPYFAVTDDKGHYSITNVPPGTYTVKAWHERLPPELKEVVIPATPASTRQDFTLGVKGLPKY